MPVIIDTYFQNLYNLSGPWLDHGWTMVGPWSDRGQTMVFRIQLRCTFCIVFCIVLGAASRTCPKRTVHTATKHCSSSHVHTHQDTVTADPCNRQYCRMQTLVLSLLLLTPVLSCTRVADPRTVPVDPRVAVTLDPRIVTLMLQIPVPSL